MLAHHTIVVVRWVVLLVLGLACADGVQADEHEAARRRVVVLNSADPDLPAFRALDDGLRDAIRANSEVPVELFAESLDMHRFPPAQLEGNVEALLRAKYRDVDVDVVVAVAPIALDFAELHGAEIWPGAAIVFNSVSVAWLPERRLDSRTSGIPVQLDFEEMVALALKLRPATRRIIVVAGIADPDQLHLLQTRAALERYTEELEVQYLVGLTFAETIAEVRALPPDATILYLTMHRDGADLPLVPRDVLRQIAEVSRAPVFGVFETYLGEGMVAGSIATYGEHGRRTGELVVRLLTGEDPSDIGVQKPAAARCIADWTQLRRWEIDESLLPENCEIRFKEVTAWDRYQSQIVLVLVVIMVQAALITVLMLNRRRLQQAKAALQSEYDRRRGAEAVATNLRERLARFSREHSLGAMAAAISHEINQPLIAIQNYAQAAKRRIDNDLDDKDRLIGLFAKIEGQAERAGSITQRVRSLVNRNDPELSPTPLHPLVAEVIQMLESDVESRGFRILCEPANDLPLALVDGLQVQLVLVNLLHNAMQSVESSGDYERLIRVDLRGPDDGEVQVSVIDRGPGVPPDSVADIFEPLYTGTSGGMGMGLAISSAVLEIHGGRLWYEPNPAGGAIFRFTVPTVSP